MLVCLEAAKKCLQWSCMSSVCSRTHLEAVSIHSASTTLSLAWLVSHISESEKTFMSFKSPSITSHTRDFQKTTGTLLTRVTPRFPSYRPIWLQKFCPLYREFCCCRIGWSRLCTMIGYIETSRVQLQCPQALNAHIMLACSSSCSTDVVMIARNCSALKH